MQRIVLASGNPGKLKEIQAILAPLDLQLVPQSEFGLDSAEETGLTFIENAILKARHVASATGLPALADDSGLAVDMLGGAPGIYSARYAGQGATDADNNAKLLAALKDVAEPQRKARFHCVIAYLRHAADPTPLIAHGLWEGQILFAPRGTHGFGYDPLFYSPAHQASSAELPPEIKNQVSHRARALRQLEQLLRPDG